MKYKKIYLILTLMFGSLIFISCSKENQAAELQVKKDIAVEDLNTKISIPIDIKSLKNDESLFIGKYKLQKNNFIVYNINSTGDGNINIGFTKEKEYDADKLFIGHSGYTSNNLVNDIFDLSNVNSIDTGTYYLWISSYDGDLKDIKGEVLITE